MVNYFHFYKIEEGFFINEKQLKQLYFQKSKENHPDLFIGDDARYDESLEQTSINNLGYKCLKNLDSRIDYVLKLKGQLTESGNKLPQAFLMQMMDVNEVIMDLKFDMDAAKLDTISKEVLQLEEEQKQQLYILAKKWDDEVEENRTIILSEMKDIYLKLKYVLRIKESLNTFASL